MTGIGKFTRWLQSRNPDKPIGISTITRIIHPVLPRHQGIIQLEDGIRMALDTSLPPERGIFFAGDRHRVLTTIMRQYVQQGAYCMDIGANIGFYTLKLAHLTGQQGRVAAFEPNPALLRRIQENIALNHFTNIDLVNAAISDARATVPFYITANSELSSLAHQSHALEEIMVHSTTIDDYIAEAGWNRLDFIKLDIEGYDCHALLGASQALRRFRPYIVLEYHYDSAPEVAEKAFTLLKDLNYSVEGVILKNGKRLVFDWRNPPAKAMVHINLFCEPMKTE
jgi:FkbM family methyltransferase